MKGMKKKSANGENKMRKMCVQRVAARLYAVVSGRKLQALPNITKAVFAGACAMMVCLAVPAGAAGSFCMPAAAAAASTRVEDIDAGEASESMENPGNGESISAVRAEGDGIQQGGLTIEVVEELSIDDQIIIDDGEIPLANYSEASADDDLVINRRMPGRAMQP